MNTPVNAKPSAGSGARQDSPEAPEHPHRTDLCGLDQAVYSVPV